MNASGAGPLAPPLPWSGRPVTGLGLGPLDTSVLSFRPHAAVQHEWSLAALATDAELVVAELTTNAIRAVAAITAAGGPREPRQRVGTVIPA